MLLSTAQIQLDNQPYCKLDGSGAIESSRCPREMKSVGQTRRVRPMASPRAARNLGSSSVPPPENSRRRVSHLFAHCYD
ncbi:putative endo-beta-1,4-glucanase D [Fusarium oxysporum f. sp. albedinis]|nr:putative endo-beta-1,4-glucanase D [Fusarium oxysporum f. sp. albedinis]